MSSFPRITLEMFHALVSIVLPTGMRVKATDVTIGREGVTDIMSVPGSNRLARDLSQRTVLDQRTVHACIIAAVGILARCDERSEGGAAANRRWIAQGRPHFTLTDEVFDIACPGGSHPRSRWNSKRRSLAIPKVDMMSVDIVKGEGEVHFIPIG